MWDKLVEPQTKISRIYAIHKLQYNFNINAFVGFIV